MKHSLAKLIHTKCITRLTICTLILLSSCQKEDIEPEDGYTEPNKLYISSVIATPTSSESVTLKNNSGELIELGGWTIGDKNDPVAYSIPNGNNIQVGASITFNASTMGFQINDSGETIYLKNSSGNTVDTWGN